MQVSMIIAGIVFATQLGQATLNDSGVSESGSERQVIVADFESQSSVLVEESEQVCLADTGAAPTGPVRKDPPTTGSVCCWGSNYCQQVGGPKCPDYHTRVPCPCPAPAVADEVE